MTRYLAGAMRLVLPLLFASACGGSMSLAQREPDEYVGCATDENWMLFDEVPDVVDDSNAPAVLSPGNGAHVSSMPIDITWQDTPTLVGQPSGDVPASCPQLPISRPC